MSQEEERRPSQFGLPVTRIVDDQAPTKDRLSDLLGRILLGKLHHREITVNPQAEEIKDIMEHAEEHDLDVVLSPTGSNTVAHIGKGIADHKLFIEVGAAAALIGTVAIVRIAGVIIRKHKR